MARVVANQKNIGIGLIKQHSWHQSISPMVRHFQSAPPATRCKRAEQALSRQWHLDKPFKITSTKNDSVDRTPGKEFRYSGGGYVVVQLLLMDTTQKSFPTFMCDLVSDASRDDSSHI
jgi:hypothetical protein